MELHGYLTAAVGVGEAARRYVSALSAAGAAVLERDVPLPGRDAIERSSSSVEGRFDPVCQIFCLNPEQMVPYIDTGKARLSSRAVRVGIWSWEVDVLPPGWREASRSLAEIWTYSEFSARLIAAGVDVPVRSVPPPIALASAGASMSGLPPGFRFLVIFDYLSTLERKNPLGAIEAFRRAFRQDDGAALIVKSINAKHRPEHHREIIEASRDRDDIVCIDRTMAAAERDGLVMACDCYVSLHRSEGHGLPIAEAMHMGKPVIATSYGGNTEFANEENSYPVAWTPVEVGAGVEHYPADAVWAQPDLDHASALLRAVYDDRQEAARRATQGRRDVLARLTPAVVGGQMISRIERLGDERETGRRRTFFKRFATGWRPVR